MNVELGQLTEVFLTSSSDFPLGPIVGGISYYDLKALIEMKDIGSIVAWASKRYKGDFEVYLEKFRADGDIGPLLLQLELSYLRRLIASVQGRRGSDMRVVAVLKAMIDKKNIVALLKGKARGVNAQDMPRYLVDGGTISKNTLAEIYRAANVEELVESLKPYFDLTAGLPAYRVDGLVALENLLEKKISQKSISSLRVAPPSLASIVAYILLKENEIENLTKIIRWKQYGVSEKEIKDSLVYA
jgi:V/A-type H+-transporting ATPase subunit C